MTIKPLIGAAMLASVVFNPAHATVSPYVDVHAPDNKFRVVSPFETKTARRHPVQRQHRKLKKEKRFHDINHVAEIPRPPRDVPDGCRSGVRALDCVVPELAAKAKEIVAACGSRVTSAVAGRGYRSNHPIRRAVDLSDNPSCIYAHLKGWKGGYSIDYNTAPGGRHVHISYNPGGQEWGARFAHGHHRTHYAARRYRVRLAHGL